MLPKRMERARLEGLSCRTVRSKWNWRWITAAAACAALSPRYAILREVAENEFAG